MVSDLIPWRSPDGASNAQALRLLYPGGFQAIAEFDRIGHLLLSRAGQGAAVSTIEGIVGIALLRRAITIYAGVRALLEQSLPDPARALARAYFELWLNFRTLAYGSVPIISLETPTVADNREPRARRYFVASERRGLRSRALMLQPNARYQPASPDERDALEKELVEEIARLCADYPVEWTYFGDVTPASVARRIVSREEPPWFAAEWPDGSVRSISALAAAFGYGWEYDYLYDAFSALVHSRGVRHEVTLDAGRADVHHPYDPTWFSTIAFFVLGWHLMFLMTAAKWISPEMVSQLQDLHRRHAYDISALGKGDHPPLLS